MMRDAEHFAQKMSKIEGSGNLGEHIVQIVRSKPLPETKTPAPVKEEEPPKVTENSPEESAQPEPPLPPPPEEAKAAEATLSEREKIESAESTRETKTNGMKALEVAAAKELPPTPAAMTEEEEKGKQNLGA